MVSVKHFFEDSINMPLLDAEQIIGKSKKKNSRPGVYFLIKNEKIVYVGQSVHPEARIRDHVLQKDFDKFYIHRCKREALNALESAYIYLYSPVLNKKRLGFNHTDYCAPVQRADLLANSTKYRRHLKYEKRKGCLPHLVSEYKIKVYKTENPFPQPLELYVSGNKWPAQIRTLVMERTGSYIQQRPGQQLKDFYQDAKELIKKVVKESDINVVKESESDGDFVFFKWENPLYDFIKIGGSYHDYEGWLDQ